MKYKKTKKPFIRVGLLLALVVLCVVAAWNLPAIAAHFGWTGQTEAPEEAANRQARVDAADRGLLILVNKEHPVEKSYKPEDLTPMAYYVTNRTAAGRYMREEAASAFSMLVEQAAREGLVVKMTTAYRSYEFQKTLYDNYVAQWGEEAASRFSAKPGQSEHQTGLAVDVSSPAVDYQLKDSFGETGEGEWLAAHAHEYGFIIRYPEGKEDVTGYLYEPWHLRYVGLFVAKEIHGQGTTLEEYLLENGI